ncbi:L-dopachrome tautomerase-related protein [Dactylosporangium sp. CA-092794]|uniref:L-dopachrome tautomerase-related protein n=1 Tax=Dactylosporangium sp. CA-092794 TaxID=3239929 RepID=UPI003D922ABA
MTETAATEDRRIVPALSNDRVCNAVATGEGRVFVGYPSADGPGLQVAEVTAAGRRIPYPDEAWNAVLDDHEPDGAFVHVNALRIGPDGQLDHHPSTVGGPLRADGQVLRGRDGDEIRLHADQLEVSPDGRYLYYQPASGGLARVETRLLDDPAVPAEALAGAVEDWLATPATGGTAIDATGTIYLSDVDRRRILAIAPDRTVRTVAADPRLVWVDAMWIDAIGELWLPAAQLNRAPGLASRTQGVDYPTWIYRMPIGAGPAPNDHG